MKFLIKKACLFVALLASFNAAAGLFHVVDFTGESDRVANEFYFYEDNIEITLSAWTTNVNSSQETVTPWERVTGPDVGLARTDWGFGVISNDQDGSDLDGGSSSNPMDLDEGILISFTETVNFLGFAVDDLTSNDDLNLSIVEFVSATEIITHDVFIDREAWSDGYDIFDVFPGIHGQHFMVWLDGNDDDVVIADMAFTHIPEPATIAMFMFGLLALNRRLIK